MHENRIQIADDMNFKKHVVASLNYGNSFVF